jgi:hypothetical protein
VREDRRKAKNRTELDGDSEWGTVVLCLNPALRRRARLQGGGPSIRAEGLQREVDQGLNVGVGIGVGQALGGGGAVGGDGLVFAAELGVEVAVDEVEDGIRRIFFFEWGGEFEGLLVILVVVVEADGEIEAGIDARERAIGDGAVELAYAVLFAAAGNAHEEAEHLGHGRERVGVVVVEAKAEVGVGEIGIERFGADEAFAGADAVAGGEFRFGAKAVEASEEGVAHAGVEVHVGGGGSVARGGDVMFGELDDFGGEIQVVIVGGELGALAGVGHVVFEFGGGGPDFPAEGFLFEEVADGMVGAVLLEFVGGVDGGGEVAGIDLVEDGLGGGGDVEILGGRRARRAERGEEKKDG